MKPALITVIYRDVEPLESLLASLDEPMEVVVVDHSESEETQRRLEGLPVTRVVAQPNRGYGAGLNRGIREAHGDPLILCNPDVKFLPGTLKPLLREVVRSGVGVVSPRLYWDEDLAWQLPMASLLTPMEEFLGAFFPRQATLRYLAVQAKSWRAERSVEVPAVAGTVMVTTREVIERVGGFNEKFFLFFEENDWCMRLGDAGLARLVVPEGGVIHPGGVSLDPDMIGRYYSQSLSLYRSFHFLPLYRLLFSRPPRPGVFRLKECDPGPLRPGDLLLLSPAPTFRPSLCHVVAEGETSFPSVPVSAIRLRPILFRPRRGKEGSFSLYPLPDLVEVGAGDKVTVDPIC